MTPQETHFILGAAGHVDHGKTALITALTGTHTDRLKEEQERGISIELGFAELELGDGVVLGVVDMPGHEKFVKQMVSGAGGVDLAFLVIAADESVMPQTVEHLEILDSLGVRSGIVVVTKTDMVDEEFTAVVREEAAELVAGTFLADKPIVAVSAHTGAGLDELRAALKAEALALPARREEGGFRLPVDRVFTMPGAGVVVTGTCWSGRVAEGDRLVLEPGATPVRVREVQVHGRRAQRGASGQRLALALHGVKIDDVERGCQVIAPTAARVSRRLDIRLNVMPHYQGTIKNRQRVHVHHAGREVLGRLVLLDVKEAGGDGGARTCLAQLHLEDELVAAHEDRLVLRFYSPVTSIGGGIVLDAAPRVHKRFAAKALEALAVLESGDPDEMLRQQLHDAGFAGLAVAEPTDHPAALRVGSRLYARELMDQLAATIGQLIADYADRFPLRLGIPKEEARRRCKFTGGANEWHAVGNALAAHGGWVVVGDRIAKTPTGPALSAIMSEAMAAALAELTDFGLDWPGLDNWVTASAVFRRAASTPALKDFKPNEVARHLVEHGQATAINNDYLVATPAREALAAKLRQHFQQHDELAFSEFRALSGLTRKLGIPMLEHLDQSGMTVRVGDVRRAGPALEKT